MNLLYSKLSPEILLSAWFDQVEAPLSTAFEAIQKTERRATETTLLNQSCTRLIAEALAGLDREGAITSFMAYEGERLKSERQLLDVLLARLGERVKKNCATADSFVVDSKRVCAGVHAILARAGETTAKQASLLVAGQQLESLLTRANNRAEGIEDSMRAITRKSSETAS
jgi:hypothetical protein